MPCTTTPYSVARSNLPLATTRIRSSNDEDPKFKVERPSIPSLTFNDRWHP